MIKPGSVVKATKAIVDTDGRGGFYLHAIPGTHGVVLPEDFTPTWPVVSWGLGGEGGVCNVSPDAFEEVKEAWYAVGGIYDYEESNKAN